MRLRFSLLFIVGVASAWHSAVLMRPRTSHAPHLAGSSQSLPEKVFHDGRATIVARRATMMASAATAQPAEPERQGVLTTLRKRLPPTSELKKIVPLAIMFFCILFNYTILRDTKDVLIVTAPGSSAEAIPFLKTWVNLPGAVAFTVAYSAMANRLGRQQLFYSVLGPFLGFFGAFAWLIYPMRNALHPVAFAAKLAAVLPAGFAAPIAVMQNWTYSLFSSGDSPTR
jgi:AAA family ATP:ADP antiporter